MNQTIVQVTVFVFACLSFLQTTEANSKARMIKIENTLKKDCNLRLVIQDPPMGVTTQSDVLFLTGFADRADNHGPLFAQLSTAGARVISFDYPSHGESACGSISYETFSTLADYVEEIESKTRVDVSRPLYLAGWSTGGLLAVRMAQKGRLTARGIKALLLLAPGVSVYSFIGDHGKVTQQTLTSNPNPPHMGPIKPTSPLSVPLFAANLKLNSLAAWAEPMPLNVPALVILAGETEDVYARTSKLKEWIRDELDRGVKISPLQCRQSKHELDNEIEPIGQEVRTILSSFVASAGTVIKSGNICRPF